MLAIPALATFITMICETFMSSSLFEDSNSLVKARRTLKKCTGLLLLGGRVSDLSVAISKQRYSNAV